jgi:hypothetical protein
MFSESNTAALQVVRAELTTLCHNAGTALDEYSNRWDQRELLDTVLQALLSLRGTFDLLELAAARSAAQEALEVLQALPFDQADDYARQQLESLTYCFALLSRYIDFIAGKTHDVPELLLPLINQLRAHNGKSSLNESAFFPIKMPSALATATDLDDLRFSGRRQRLLFQLGLLHVLTRAHADSGLRLMRKASERLGEMSPTLAADVWTLTSQLTQAIPNKLPLTAMHKRLFSQVERYLSEQIKAAKNNHYAQPSEVLVRGLLYHCSLIEQRNSAITQLLEKYHASSRPMNHQELADAHHTMLAPTEATYRVVIEQVREEIAAVHGDLSHRQVASPGSEVDATALAEQARRLGQTLMLAEQNSLGEDLVAAANALARHAQRQLVACNNAVVEFTNTFAKVKLSLDQRLSASRVRSELDASETLSPPVDEHRAQSLVDLRHYLHDVMHSFDKYIDADFQRSHLQAVPDALNRLCHALTFSGLELLAEPLQQCSLVVNDALAPTSLRPLSRAVLNVFADVFTACDYAMECLINQQPIPSHVKELTTDAMRDLEKLRHVA